MEFLDSEIINNIEKWQTLISVLMASVVIPVLMNFLKSRKDNKKNLFLFQRVVVKSINETFESKRYLEETLGRIDSLIYEIENHKDGPFLAGINVVYEKISTSQDQILMIKLQSNYLMNKLDMISSRIISFNNSLEILDKQAEATGSLNADNIKLSPQMENFDNLSDNRKKSIFSEQRKDYIVNLLWLKKNISLTLEHNITFFLNLLFSTKVIIDFYHIKNYLYRWSLEGRSFKLFTKPEKYKNYYIDNFEKINNKFSGKTNQELERSMENFFSK